MMYFSGESTNSDDDSKSGENEEDEDKIETKDNQSGELPTKRQKKTAPGEGAWSKREKRKIQIAEKNAQIYEMEPGRHTRKQIHKDPMDSSLATILESLKGYRITVDLKNDETVVGKLESVDKDMNIVLEKTMDSNENGSTNILDNGTVEIKGSSIFLVHMPSGLDIRSHVEKFKMRKEAEIESRKRKAKSLTAQA